MHRRYAILAKLTAPILCYGAGMKWGIILLLLSGCAKPEPIAFDWDNQQWVYMQGKNIKGVKTLDKILDRR